MAFTGTLDKCKACDKTVYVMDLMTLEGMPYHKSCFRCSHCNGTLVVSIFFLSVLLFLTPLFLLIFIISRRLATTHPWMEFCTASPILNNFSKNLETSARIFRQVNLLPLLISHLLESLTILATYSHLSAGKTEKSSDVVCT